MKPLSTVSCSKFPLKNTVLSKTFRDFFFCTSDILVPTCHQTIINGRIPGGKTPFIIGVITAASLANIACNLLQPSEKIITCFRAGSQFY